MNFWDNVKKDLQKGFKEGLAYVKEGATFVKDKAEELTDEGKKQYRLFELKAKVQREITELGGKVYDASKRTKNPMLDAKVKSVMERITKLEAQIGSLEVKPKAKKKAAKKKTAKKKKAAKKKTAAKKTASVQ